MESVNPDFSPFHCNNLCTMPENFNLPHIWLQWAGHPHWAQESTEMRSLHRRGRENKEIHFSQFILSLFVGVGQLLQGDFAGLLMCRPRLLAAGESCCQKVMRRISWSIQGAFRYLQNSNQCVGLKLNRGYIHNMLFNFFFFTRICVFSVWPLPEVQNGLMFF